MSHPVGQMRITPRRGILAQAKWDIAQAIHKAIEKHDLSYVELTSILVDELKSWNGYELRDEWDLDMVGASPAPDEGAQPATGSKEKSNG